MRDTVGESWEEYFLNPYTFVPALRRADAPGPLGDGALFGQAARRSLDGTHRRHSHGEDAAPLPELERRPPRLRRGRGDHPLGPGVRARRGADTTSRRSPTRASGRSSVLSGPPRGATAASPCTPPNPAGENYVWFTANEKTGTIKGRGRPLPFPYPQQRPDEQLTVLPAEEEETPADPPRRGRGPRVRQNESRSRNRRSRRNR